MCNAWNHPLNCNCGWGDGGWGGGGSGGGAGWHIGGGLILYREINDGRVFPFPFSDYLSYVNPNAHCPVCGASVYFYQSPYGGRVFFDELGPPWAKHPCTDNPQMRPHLAVGSDRSFLIAPNGVTQAGGWDEDERDEPPLTAVPATPDEPLRVTAWAVDGWMPFVVTEIVRRRIGIEAVGKLFQSAGAEPITFRIKQSSMDAQYYITQGDIRIGSTLVVNANPILSVLNECPIMLKRDPDMESLLLSSFVLSSTAQVEEIVLSVHGVMGDEESQSE